MSQGVESEVVPGTGSIGVSGWGRASHGRGPSRARWLGRDVLGEEVKIDGVGQGDVGDVQALDRGDDEDAAGR